MLKGFFVFLIGIVLTVIPFIGLSEWGLKAVLVFFGIILIGIGYAVTNNFFNFQQTENTKMEGGVKNSNN